MERRSASVSFLEGMMCFEIVVRLELCKEESLQSLKASLGLSNVERFT